MDDKSNGNEVSRKIIFFSLFWKGLERISVQAVNFTVQIVLARLLMPEDFAGLAMIAAITNFAAVFVQAGLSTAIVQKENLDELDISTTYICSLTAAAFLYLILFISAPLIASYMSVSDLLWPLRILSLVIFLYAVNAVQTAILQRKMLFKKIFLCNFVAAVLSGIIGAALACLGLKIWALVIYNLVHILSVIITMKILGKIRICARVSFQRMIAIYAFSGKIILSSLLSQIYEAARTVAIGHAYQPALLAYYDKANTYSYYILQTVSSSLSSVLLPVFSRQQDQIDLLCVLARRAVRITAFIMFPVMILTASVSAPLVKILLTEKWTGCIPYFTVFCFMRLPGCYNAIDKQIYLALGKSSINLKYEIFNSLLNMIFLLFTIKKGPFAVAVGVMMTEFLMAFLIFYYSQMIYGYKAADRMKDLVRPAMNSLIMFFSVRMLISLNIPDFIKLGTGVFAGIAVYLLMAVITGDENIRYAVSVIKGYFNKLGNKKEGQLK